MPAPINHFKQALIAKQPQIGLWLALASPLAAEVVAQAGFDWLLIDAEHGPNDVPLILSQLQALSTGTVHPIVRVPIGEVWLLKQMLDIGAQTILVPMVESAAQAELLSKAMRYPPSGIRGVGAALARASGFNAIPDYLKTADAQVCLLVQIESKAGLAALPEIVKVPGVDGVFIGPADLAADLGHLGNPAHPEVQQAVTQALHDITAAGKPAGILTADFDLAQSYLKNGALFVAVGNDVNLLGNSARQLAQKFKSTASASIPTTKAGSY